MDHYPTKSLRVYPDARARRDFLKKELHVATTHIEQFSFDEEQAAQYNIENMIGATQVPLGLAGPLLIAGEKAKGNFYLPLATTEGALVASLSRGCKAISVSGGVSVYTCRVGQTRGPVFEVSSLAERKKLYEWITQHKKEIGEMAEQTSKHVKLQKIFIQGVGRYLFVRFSFDTDDAMGMNMVTIATQAIAHLIEEKTNAPCLAIAGNFDIDKKPAWLNVINNRGLPVWAESVIKKDVVSDILKTTPERFFDVWLGKCMVGSAISGSLGFNAHYANIIAALFIATGQDPAHVVEGSMGITTARVLAGGDLLVSIYLPALLIGTVGGGTTLSTQKEALAIMGVSGEGNSEKFAEIIGASVLAGEISLLASLSEGSLAKAHQTLGRGGRE